MNLPAPGTASPWVIAHRGVSVAFPENTLAAFDAALAVPADAVELDLQRSRDGVPVVWHDRTLGKAGAPLRRVAGMGAAELARLDAGAWRGPSFAGQRIPTLDQVLARYASRVPLLLEIKMRGGSPGFANVLKLADTVVDRVRAGGLGDRVCLLCFRLEVLERVVARAPELRCVWNLDAPPPPGAETERRMAPLAAACLNVAALEAPFVEAMHRLGKSVLTFTVNTPGQLKRALEAGADGLIGDDPGWLAQALEKEGRR